MRFTKTLTFERVLTDSLQIQERVLDHFNEVPLLTTQTKVTFTMPLMFKQSYKEVSEILTSQLRTVFEGYLQASTAQGKGESLCNTMELSSLHSTHVNHQHQHQQVKPQHYQPSSGVQSPFQQTQDLQAENDYLKRQLQALKYQVDEKANESRVMLEQTQTKDQELRELVDMVRTYEDQIRELQAKLEEQIVLHQEREDSKHIKQSLEIQGQQEIQQVKLLFQEFILVKDDIEKQLEALVKRVLEKDGDEAEAIEKAQLFSGGQSALAKFKEGFSNRKIQDIMRAEISEMKELSEVVRDLSSLIVQTVSEKHQLQASLQAELDLRQQIENALERQEVEQLSSDLLIMKIKTLEHALNQVQEALNPNASLDRGQVASPSKSYQAYLSLRVVQTEILDEKVRLQERVRHLETQLSQQGEDLENLMARLAEAEKEAVDLKLTGDKRLDEEKRKLLAEVEEIRKREEVLEQEIQRKLEEEITRMQSDQENELTSCFIKQTCSLLRLSDADLLTKSYEEQWKHIECKGRALFDKIEALQENKDLMTREKLMLEERMQEIAYENGILSKKVEQQAQQLQSQAYAYQQELKGLREDRDQINSNANLLMTKFRQTASELHEVRDDREALRRGNKDLKEIVENLERRNRGPNILQTNSVIVNSRPPLCLIKSEALNSPVVPQRISDSLRKPVQAYQQAQSHTRNENSEFSSPMPSNPNQGQTSLRQSIDEKQLSSLIQDYKQENQKFSQKVHELQRKIQCTAQLSPFKQGGTPITQSQRANSSKPAMRNSQMSGQPREDQNRLFFSTISPQESHRQEHTQYQTNQQQQQQQQLSARGPGMRTLSCSVKKRQQ